MPSLISSLWSTWCGVWSNDPFLIGWVGLPIVIMVEYFIVSALFMIVDHTGRPNWIHKYKVQLNAPTVTWHIYWAIFKQMNINIILVHLPVSFLVIKFMIAKNYDFGELPSFLQVLRTLVMCAIISEPVFYYTHRFLHLPVLYKHVHKVHHRLQAPVAASAIYSHPIEYLLSSMPTLYLGPLLFGTHMFELYVYGLLALFSVMNDHCGYHLPLMHSPQAHDWHHLKFTECYGVYGLCDWLHNTDIGFRRTVNFERNHVLLGTTPVHITHKK